MKYVGDPIDCMHHVNSMDSKTFDTFCWVEGTYSKRNPEVTGAEARAVARGFSIVLS